MRELSVVNRCLLRGRRFCVPDSLSPRSQAVPLTDRTVCVGLSGTSQSAGGPEVPGIKSAYSMGDVVELESSAPGAARAEAIECPEGAARRGGRSKTALVLGGGGFTGGVYEIGALRALDLLSVNRTVNEFDIYVGTSAGSFVAGLLAAGLTPEEMSRVVNQPGADAVPGRGPRRPAAPELRRLRDPRPADAAADRRPRPQPRGPLARGLADGRLHRPCRGTPIRPLHRRRDRALHPRRVPRERPHRRFPAAGGRAVPDRDGPRHVRAHRVRRAGLGRRADLQGRVGVDRAADGLPAGRGARADS